MKPLFVCFLTGIIGLFGAVQSTSAATFNIENSDVAALAEAIEIANSNNQDDIINLAKQGSYTLKSPLSNIEADKGRRLAINGAGAKIVRSDTPDKPFTLLKIEKNATVFVSLLTLTGGVATHGYGGAIFSSGNLKLTDCTLAGNTAEFMGGAIYSNGALQLIGCTLAENKAVRGGAIYQEDGTAQLFNCTISGNKASLSAGGIDFQASNVSATSILSHCTFNDNIAESGDDIVASGDDQSAATVQFDNSIFNSKNAARNLESAANGVLVSKGNNMCLDDSGNLKEGSDQSDTDALLKPLADNGGPTLTHMFDADSKALDNGSWGAIPMKDGVVTDQRGKVRPQGPTYDIGSCEMDNLYAPLVEEGTI